MSNSKKRSEEKSNSLDEIGVDKNQLKQHASDRMKNSEAEEEQKASDSQKSSDHHTPGSTRPPGMDA